MADRKSSSYGVDANTLAFMSKAVGTGLQLQGIMDEATSIANASREESELVSKSAAFNIDQIFQQGSFEARKQRLIARKTFGSIRAAYGASGVTMEGSPSDVLAENVAEAAYDAQQILQNTSTRINATYDDAKYRKKVLSARAADALSAAKLKQLSSITGLVGTIFGG